ncbi:MAG: internalization-related competence protein ComEC/Rec2 [Gemmatimonadetes bacterium]|nr:internalization-related competence protein ComEC/Rec2 [Gemmatimonadota bacterium]
MIPPPGVLMVFCFGAGLATGLSHFWALACGMMVTGTVAVLVRRDVAVFAATAAIGIGVGAVARQRDDASCAARLPVGRVALEALLLEPLTTDGGIASLEPVHAGCSGVVTARFRRGRALEAGSRLAIEGEWTRGTRRLIEPDGMLGVKQVTPKGQVRRVEFGARNALAAATARLYGARAPLVDALVVGRRSGMDRELKASFASSGLVHLLSISGFHIGLLAAWVVLLLHQLGVSRVPALTVAASVATGYVAFLGWPAPAVRAGAMAWVLVWLRWRQRAVQPEALLAATGLAVLLLDPFAVFDLGGWLSVLSLWGAVRFARWAEEAGGRHWMWQSAASSLGATVATAPVTAWLLGAVAPVGIVLNFLAIPVAAVAVPGVLASLLAAPAGPVAAALASGSGVALHLLELVAEWGARIPLGHFVMPAAAESSVPWLLVLGLLCWATPRRGSGTLAWGRMMLAGATGVWLALVPELRLPQSGAGRLTLHFVDVGQGDAAVLRTPNGHFVVIDAGPRDERFDAGASRVVPVLAREGAASVDVLVASHAHLDHVGGFGAVLAAVPVGTVLEPAAPGADATYREMLGLVGRSGAAWDAARRGERFTVDSVDFTVLHPDTTWSGWGLDLNDDSVVLLVRYGGFRAIFMGDAGEAPEAALRGRVGRVDLLKAGHHGSRTASGAAWLEELSPTVAILSVGSHNRYGHPAPEALQRLGAQHATIWRTDQEGTVTVVTDGRHVEVRGRSRRLGFDVAGSPANISLESPAPCAQRSPPSSDSSWTRNGTSRMPRGSSRACSTTSPSPPS